MWDAPSSSPVSRPGGDRCGAAILLLAATILLASAADAYPDGAPWGAADPESTESCGSCHYGAEPVRASGALRIQGLPKAVRAGATYHLVILVDDAEATITGFQLLATVGDQPAGRFETGAGDIQCRPAACRSTAPRRQDQTVNWELSWTAPGVLADAVLFRLAVTAANDDASPLGDVVHYGSFSVPVD